MTAKQENKKAVQAATRGVKSAQAANKLRKGTPLVTLSNGIRLRCKPVPPLLLDHVSQQMPEPMPPQVKIVIEDREDRWEENPDDPEYLASLQRWKRQSNMAAINAMLLVGTEAERVPNGYFMPEDNGWLDILKTIGINVEFENAAERYLAWLKLSALAETKDIGKITEVVGSSLGIKEEDVARAAETFQSPKVGAVNSEDAS